MGGAGKLSRCEYEAVVAGQPGIEKHLRKLGIGPGDTIYLAPAESRDYYLTRTTGGTDGRYYQTVYKDQKDPGVGRCNKNKTAGIQWACGACAGMMTSEANMRDRILVLFSFENEDPEVDNDPYCIRLGRYDPITEGMIAFLKECTLKVQLYPTEA